MPEVRALSQVLSNAEIIRAMTLHAAIFLHREQEIGSIAPGMIADLVLLEGNPLTDLSALEQVRQVIHKGRLTITGG
jgi:imidazolonepropionase-like amidohydrolase